MREVVKPAILALPMLVRSKKAKRYKTQSCMPVRAVRRGQAKEWYVPMG